MFAATTEPQSTNDQKMVMPSRRALDKTPSAVASCSSVLKIAFLILSIRRERAGALLSSHVISAADRRLNQIRNAIPTSSSAKKPRPIVRTRSEERRVG